LQNSQNSDYMHYWLGTECSFKLSCSTPQLRKQTTVQDDVKQNRTVHKEGRTNNVLWKEIQSNNSLFALLLKSRKSRGVRKSGIFSRMNNLCNVHVSPFRHRSCSVCMSFCLAGLQHG